MRFLSEGRKRGSRGMGCEREGLAWVGKPGYGKTAQGGGRCFRLGKSVSMIGNFLGIIWFKSGCSWGKSDRTASLKNVLHMAQRARFLPGAFRPCSLVALDAHANQETVPDPAACAYLAFSTNATLRLFPNSGGKTPPVDANPIFPFSLPLIDKLAKCV